MDKIGKKAIVYGTIGGLLVSGGLSLITHTNPWKLETRTQVTGVSTTYNSLDIENPTTIQPVKNYRFEESVLQINYEWKFNEKKKSYERKTLVYNFKNNKEDATNLVKVLMTSKINEDLLKALQVTLGDPQSEITTKQYVNPEEIDEKFITLTLYDKSEIVKTYKESFTDNLEDILFAMLHFLEFFMVTGFFVFCVEYYKSNKIETKKKLNENEDELIEENPEEVYTRKRKK